MINTVAILFTLMLLAFFIIVYVFGNGIISGRIHMRILQFRSWRHRKEIESKIEREKREKKERRIRKYCYGEMKPEIVEKTDERLFMLQHQDTSRICSMCGEFVHGIHDEYWCPNCKIIGVPTEYTTEDLYH